jgi:hypothetical protein
LEGIELCRECLLVVTTDAGPVVRLFQPLDRRP